MEIERSEQDGRTLVRVKGCLDTAATADFNRVLAEIPDGVSGVTFDFADLEFISSSSLRSMVALAKRLEPAGARISIRGANEVVRDVFEMTGLDEVFEVL